MSAPTTPCRIQRSRAKGWKMPEGAIYCGRPSRWGNPFSVVKCMRYDRSVYWSVVTDPSYSHRHVSGCQHRRYEDAVEEAVVLHYRWLLGDDWRRNYLRRCPGQAAHIGPLLAPPTLSEIRDALGGRDLACWCPVTTDEENPLRCHVDTLLLFANAKQVTTAIRMPKEGDRLLSSVPDKFTLCTKADWEEGWTFLCGDGGTLHTHFPYLAGPYRSPGFDYLSCADGTPVYLGAPTGTETRR